MEKCRFICCHGVSSRAAEDCIFMQCACNDMAGGTLKAESVMYCVFQNCPGIFVRCGKIAWCKFQNCGESEGRLYKKHLLIALDKERWGEETTEKIVLALVQTCHFENCEMAHRQMFGFYDSTTKKGTYPENGTYYKQPSPIAWEQYTQADLEEVLTRSPKVIRKKRFMLEQRIFIEKDLRFEDCVFEWGGSARIVLADGVKLSFLRCRFVATHAYNAFSIHDPKYSGTMSATIKMTECECMDLFFRADIQCILKKCDFYSSKYTFGADILLCNTIKAYDCYLSGYDLTCLEPSRFLRCTFIKVDLDDSESDLRDCRFEGPTKVICDRCIGCKIETASPTERYDLSIPEMPLISANKVANCSFYQCRGWLIESDRVSDCEIREYDGTVIDKEPQLTAKAAIVMRTEKGMVKNCVFSDSKMGDRAEILYLESIQ